LQKKQSLGEKLTEGLKEKLQRELTQV